MFQPRERLVSRVEHSDWYLTPNSVESVCYYYVTIPN